MEHSSDLTVEAMMLDSKAADLDKEERPEVFILSSFLFWAFVLMLRVFTFHFHGSGETSSV